MTEDRTRTRRVSHPPGDRAQGKTVALGYLNTAEEDLLSTDGSVAVTVAEAEALGGEALSIEHVREGLRRLPQTRLIKWRRSAFPE